MTIFEEIKEQRIQNQLKKDAVLWSNCVKEYDKHIIHGHPDITAYEHFEEKLIDELLMELSFKTSKPLKIIDVCSGPGRIAERYQKQLSENKFPYNLIEIESIDFTNESLNMAKAKIDQHTHDASKELGQKFVGKSAFNLEVENSNHIPIALNLNNSIGIMQGHEGAEKLFSSMRNSVEEAKGIAIISCYLNDYVEKYALNQYESTMQVSGQPHWLVPTDFIKPDYKLVAKSYKTKNDKSTKTYCDVYSNDKLVKEDFVLSRDPHKVRAAVLSGNIKTYDGYSSMWYSETMIAQWIKTYWKDCNVYHILTRYLDPENAELGQLAILDCGNYLQNFFKDN